MRGLTERDFNELGDCQDEDEIRERFRGRVDALIDEVNDLPSAHRLLPRLQQLHSRAKGVFYRDGGQKGRYIYVHQTAHWYFYNRGGRWEPQFQHRDVLGESVPLSPRGTRVQPLYCWPRSAPH